MLKYVPSLLAKSSVVNWLKELICSIVIVVAYFHFPASIGEAPGAENQQRTGGLISLAGVLFAHSRTPKGMAGIKRAFKSKMVRKVDTAFVEVFSAPAIAVPQNEGVVKSVMGLGFDMALYGFQRISHHGFACESEPGEMLSLRASDGL